MAEFLKIIQRAQVRLPLSEYLKIVRNQPTSLVFKLHHEYVRQRLNDEPSLKEVAAALDKLAKATSPEDLQKAIMACALLRLSVDEDNMTPDLRELVSYLLTDFDVQGHVRALSQTISGRRRSESNKRNIHDKNKNARGNTVRAGASKREATRGR